ncbi:MAG TPA: AAA family ATPase [Bacteroidales bacterium]|nr:AAA family ATPase [Bacteroidales bacterium]HRZ48505.1 AAA family ATPase [Bacteroidales bacterium]
MNIERQIIPKLELWRNKQGRKPLILQGARQVGKTFLLKQFGASHFADCAYFNFEKQPGLKQFFAQTKDPNILLEKLILVHGRKIKPEETLIIFDEIQECNDALNALKYFCEEAPEYVITGAGSLLGVALSRGASFPVGKVDLMHLYPLTFNEFLSASDPALYAFISSINEVSPIPDIFFHALQDKLKVYFISGGMPEAVCALLGDQDVEKTQEVLDAIIQTYMLDFSKHIESRNIARVQYLWTSMPSQLARENRKFLYSAVKKGARAREYEDALLWLIQAGLAYRVSLCQKPNLPLSGYHDLTSFKLYFSDVGLLRKMAALHPLVFSEGSRIFTEFKGALTENYILTVLLQQFEGFPGFWKSGNEAEVDFLIQYRNQIIPVEVKSDQHVKSQSLAQYRKQWNPAISIRYSLRNLKFDQGVLNIPLFMADQTQKLLDSLFLFEDPGILDVI